MLVLLLRRRVRGGIMKFSTYADVLTPEHPLSKAYTNGHKRNAGTLLSDLLRDSEGRYEVTVELPLRLRDDMQRLAKLTADPQLASYAEQSQVAISLEHLRDYDPKTTRVVYGYRLDREPTDGKLPGFDQ
jgi:hypothetical protein